MFSLWLTNGVVIQTVSEFIGSIMKPKMKKRGKRKSSLSSENSGETFPRSANVL
jgi:hypothetical protein